MQRLQVEKEQKRLKVTGRDRDTVMVQVGKKGISWCMRQ
jgi:hypothetical protein